MSGHTLGPWEIDQEYLGDSLVNHVPISSKKHGSLAQVVWVMEDDKYLGLNSPTCEANARLIAAAPELLDALKLMLEQFTTTPSTLKDSEARIKAHAVIAKATTK